MKKQLCEAILLDKTLALVEVLFSEEMLVRGNENKCENAYTPPQFHSANDVLNLFCKNEDGRVEDSKSRNGVSSMKERVVVLSNAEGMKRINESNGKKNNILLECEKGVNKKEQI